MGKVLAFPTVNSKHLKQGKCWQCGCRTWVLKADKKCEDFSAGLCLHCQRVIQGKA